MDAPVRTESQGVDGVGVVEGVEVLPVVQVPQHVLCVLAARGAEGTIWAHGHRVQITCGWSVNRNLMKAVSTDRCG